MEKLQIDLGKWDFYKVFLVVVMTITLFVIFDHKTFVGILLALGIEKELDEIRKETKESH